MRLIALVLIATACGDVTGETVDAPKPPDASNPDSPDGSTARCNPNAPFGIAEPLPGINTTTSWETGGSLSPDELTIYFSSDRVGTGTVGGTDIYIATRPALDQPFGMPVVLANVNTTGADEWPSVTADGLYVYFDRHSTATGWDIYGAERLTTTANFSQVMKVASLNAADPVTDANQFVMGDHSAVYWSSARGATYDIWRAKRNVGGTFDTAMLASIPTADSQETVALTADELTILFSSTDPTGLGMNDIWIAKRSTVSDGFGMPQQSGLSTTGNEHIIWISADGCNAYLMRYSGNDIDIYWARRPQ